MLRTDHPIKFNNVTIPYMSGWEEGFEVVENVYETEAGTDDVEIVRYGKLTVSCSTTCFVDTLRALIPFSTMNSFTLTRYDPLTGGNTTSTVRMRDFKYKLKEKTWNTGDGIWDVSFTLKEF